MGALLRDEFFRKIKIETKSVQMIFKQIEARLLFTFIGYNLSEFKNGLACSSRIT